MSAALDRYHRAASMLAISVDITNQIATDPAAPGDRGPRADAGRRAMFEKDLAEFRAAKAALDAENRS